MKIKVFGLSLLCLGSAAAVVLTSSKPKGVSRTTGWNYNDSKLGGFSVADFKGQLTGPGLAFVEGGTFTMGQTDEDIYYTRSNIPRRVTVSSFYMDETEVANVDYREYLYWLKRTYGSDYPELIDKARPDEGVWRSALSYNEPYVDHYFTYAGFDHYPVVGVNWYQANDYAAWRTDRVNEMILIKNGVLKKNVNQVNEDNFNSDAYANEQYLGTPGAKKPRDLDPNGAGRRNATYADGMLLPEYRLPTEAEWEYAALGLIDKNPEKQTKRRRGEEALTDRKANPWGDFRTTRDLERGSKYRGQYLANYKRGAGDAMGVTGGLNDDGDYTVPVFSYEPNAYGLYNMAGNVSEWCLDVFRPTALQDFNDHNPFVGNEYNELSYEDDYTLTEKDSLGHLDTKPLDSTRVGGNKDYTSADERGILEQGAHSEDNAYGNALYVYDYGRTSTLNNDTRVIKGGSWDDLAYWLNPGTRRGMQANYASSTVGFRCVMSRLGSPSLYTQGGNYFGDKHRSK